MKTLFVFLSLISAMLAPMPTLADTLMGCEIVQSESGGYSNKADPACVFTVDATAGGGESTNKPAT